MSQTKVNTVVAYVELEGDYATVPGVCVTCERCDHSAEAFGQSSASVRRANLKLREDCPRNERNFYIALHGEDR